MKKALIIFTKVPMVGLVKTRLAHTLNLESVTELYRSFLLDTIDLADRISKCKIIIAYTPVEAARVLRNIVKKPIEFIIQSEGNLGCRMNNVFKELFSRGFESAVMIGADSPTLPLSYLKSAFEALESNQVVLGPSIDGGYYLIGLNAPQPELFKGIKWSTGQVLNQTVNNITSLGLQMHCINRWYDVDTADDLNLLVSQIRFQIISGNSGLPHHTLSALRRLGIFKESG